MPLFILLLMVLWFGHEMVWAGKIPLFRDLGPYFYPMRFSLAESLKAGELPLWDPHVAMGFPLLADFQSGVFYPPHLFYLILPFFRAVGVGFLFHYLVAATGGYMLCRRWGYPPYLAIIGAVLFTLGGTIVSLTNLLNHFQTAVWLPWVIFLGERCVQEQSWKNFLIFTLVLLLQFLAGSPELYAMSLGLLLLDGVRMKLEERNTTYWKSFCLFVSANALVVGLSMVQILLTWELLMESRVSRRIAYVEASAWSLHPVSLINLFFLDKVLEPEALTLPRLLVAPQFPFFVSYYMGWISLIGISLWFYYASKKEKAVLLALITASLVTAMGDYTPLYSFLFNYMPFFGLFRFPEKFFFIAYALLFFIALRGLFCFLHSDHSSSRMPIIIVLSISLLSLLLYLFLRFDTEPLSRFIAWSTHAPGPTTATLAKSSWALVSLERQIALSWGIFLLFFLCKRGKLRVPLFNVLLVAFVFIDLKSAHQPYQYLLDPGLVYNSPRIIANPDPQPHRLFYLPSPSGLHPSTFAIRKERPFAEYTSLVFSNLLPNTGLFHGFGYMQEIDALGRWPYTLFLAFANKLPPERQYRLLGALNVRYLNSFRELSDGGVTLVRYFPQYPSWLYRIDRVTPRVYIAARTMEQKNPFAVLDKLSSAEFDPAREVILEQPLSIPTRKDFAARAEIIHYGNQHVAIRSSLNGSGVLVLADSFYPGWRVYVNGEEKEILRANLFFRGVVLSPGEQLVEFRYQPRSFTIGLVISLVVLSGVVVWSIALFIIRRRATLRRP